MVQLRFNTDASKVIVFFKDLKFEVNKEIDKGLDQIGKELVDFIRYDLLSGQLVKRKTGELERGIYYKRISKTKVRVAIKGKHYLVGKWIDEGIGHTWLIPKSGIATKMQWRVEGTGAWVTVHKVITHPGIKPRKFMRAGAIAKRKRIREIMVESVRRASHQFRAS